MAAVQPAFTLPAGSGTLGRVPSPEAFEALILPHLERLALHVRRSASSVVGADCDEEDVVQTALATAWRLFPDLEPRGPEATWGWLRQLADHAVSDRVKYVRAKGRAGVRHAGTVAPEAALEPRDPTTSVTRLAARRDLRRRVDQVLRGLEPGQREVVVRHLLDGQTLAEIARGLGVTKNAAWERLHRGLLRLRGALDGEELP